MEKQKHRSAIQHKKVAKVSSYELQSCICLYDWSEAEDSNETPSSEEDQDLVDYNPDLTIKQSISSSSRKSISQIIKDKKKQTQLTLQW